MSLIIAEINTHPLFLWTDLVNYSSFHWWNGLPCNIGWHWEPDDMFASNRLCLLISIQPFSTVVCRYAWASSTVTAEQPYMLRVTTGGPAAAHVWQGCCGFWESSHKGPKLGLSESMRQNYVVMISLLFGVIQKPYPQNIADIWIKNQILIFFLKYAVTD